MKKKKNASRKKMPMELRSFLVTLLVIAITFGILIPLHFTFPESMTPYWVIAISAAVISPFVIANTKIYFESKNNYSEEQKKNASARFGMDMLTVWYADFVFVCYFMDWLVAFFVFAGIFLTKLVYDTTMALYKRKDSFSYPKIAIIVDYLFGMALLVLIIYKIPDEALRTIILSLGAALVGGLLTLLGVMFTIKRSDRDRKEDEEKKARPLFAYNILRQEPKLDYVMQRVCISDSMEPGNLSCDVFVELENSDRSVFEIKGFFHDGGWVKAEGNTVVLPNSRCIVNFRFSDKPHLLFMEVEDGIGNPHYYQLWVLYLGTQSSAGKLLHTIREIKPISKADMEKAMGEGDKAK